MISLRPAEHIRDLRPRFQAMVLIVLLTFAGLVGRLCQLQVLEGEHYARRAERNFVDVVDVEAPRGRIFDATGKPLATNRPAYALHVTGRPRVIEDPGLGVVGSSAKRVPVSDATIDVLVSLLEFVDDEDRTRLVAEIVDLRDNQDLGIRPALVRNNLSWQEYARIQTRLDVLSPWVEIRESSRRHYPEGELTAFVTGYMRAIDRDSLTRGKHTGYRPGDRIGATGIERQWENYLRGRLGARPRVVDARGREVVDAPPDTKLALPPPRDPIPGQDIFLTLDLELQRVALAAFADKPAGAVVAMEVKTGRILVMLSVPAIDPNRWEQPIVANDFQAWNASPLKPFVDKTVQEHFFPGSTYKVVSALAVLDDAKFDAEATVTCDGFVVYGNRRFKCTHRHGPVDLEQAIAQSCNVYFYTLAMDKNTNLNLERMERLARKLGLGERTGLGLNGEVKGRIPTEAFEAREGTYQAGVRLNSAIGQGNVNVTVLQEAVLYAAIANGGYVLTPYIVERVVTNDYKLVLSGQPQPKNDHPVIDPVDRERIHLGLVGAVNSELGTAYSERLEGITVAGKTGTAQVGAAEAGRKPDASQGTIPGWDTSQHHAWFAGYAPAENPEIVVVAFVEHGGTGADAAAPTVMRIIEAHLRGSSSSREGSKRRPPGVPPPLPGQKDEQVNERGKR